VASAVEQAVHINVADRDAEWAEDAITVNLPRPGGDGFVSIDPVSGAITSELTDRGLLSLANDLHKGRNAGGPWVVPRHFCGRLRDLHTHRPAAAATPFQAPPLDMAAGGAGLIVPLLLVHFLVP
jgi:hypothetical protein